jgi:hypothetical protein
VFLKLSASLFLTAALAVPAAASEPQPRHEPRNQPPRVDRQAEVELVCRSVETAGGAEAPPMVCMTAADWRRSGQ